jgi:hypothetical protein
MNDVDFETIRRIGLISDAAYDMDELIHGDALARVMVVAKSVVANARKFPGVEAIVAQTDLLARLEAEGRVRMARLRGGDTPGGPGSAPAAQSVLGGTGGTSVGASARTPASADRSTDRMRVPRDAFYPAPKG